jgi:hypothetical protein
VQCDCEKILTDTNGDEDANALARVQGNKKAEEWLNIYASVIVPTKHFKITGNTISEIFSFPSIGFTGSVFQPPKFS